VKREQRKARSPKTQPKRKEPKKTRPIRATERGRIGDFSYVRCVLDSQCGTTHRFWPLPTGPLPVTAVLVNVGLCSITAAIVGVGGPQSVSIPSAGGADPKPQVGTLFHPGGTSITIECLPTVAGGDCRVLIALLYP